MKFAEGELTCDGFGGGRLHLYQPRQGYRAGTDPVLLAAFTPAAPGARVLDLGCGGGTAALCLAARTGPLDLHGLELQAAYADLARRNAARNAIAMTVHEGDLRHPPAALRALSFDHVLLNPPFYAAGAATGARDRGRDIAHREDAALPDWIDAALRRLAPGGTLTLIHRAERLPELLAALTPRAGKIEILPVLSRPHRPARRLLLRARKASAAPLTLHAPFLVHRGTAHSDTCPDYTDAARSVIQDLSELLPGAP